MHYALYCKVETGWCSRRPKNKSPDRDDSFDWEPASCKGNFNYTFKDLYEDATSDFDCL